MTDLLTTIRHTGLPRLAAPFFPDILWRGPDSARTLYLTFDDGPDETTPALLDLLAQHGVAATFFLLGERARRRPDLVRAVRAAGHTIGQHTDTHVDAWRTPAVTIAAEMERATETLADITDEVVRWMRPPYGHFTPRMRAWCRARGQRIVMWDAMPGDFLSSATPQTVSRRTLRLARPGSVLVLHEGGHARSVTPPALARALPALLADGYRFAAL
jgi:peptidoglycan/xylan/chitin deacetylase (PgdA/CDA1 family)